MRSNLFQKESPRQAGKSKLVDIIANYLQIPVEKAKSLMALLSLEKRWQEDQKWKEQTYSPSAIKTQADLINFLQAVGQSQWFKGHDRSKFADIISHQQMNDQYYSLFEGIGLTQVISYDALKGAPEFSVVLGSSESQVTSRAGAFKRDVLANLGPIENRVFGLGCNRGLGVSVVESEKNSQEKLQDAGKEATEMNMVSLITEEALYELSEQDPKFKAIAYQAVNVTAAVKTREEKECVKTADTAVSLKQAIENQYDISKKQKPINIAVYSRQPYVLRQQRDVQQKLGSDYNVIGVGDAFTQESFNNNPKSINIFLGELARLINIDYTPENLKKFDVALTESEVDELMGLAGLAQDSSDELEVIHAYQ